MKKQLAEVVDGTEIKEITEQEILYSCENNGANDLCSTKNNATCGDLCFINSISAVSYNVVIRIDFD
jgi:hypothetical protein